MLKPLNNLDLSQLLAEMDFWSKAGPHCDTILSTRVQLVRNIYGIPFAFRQNQSNVNHIRIIAEKFIEESSYSGLELVEIHKIDDNGKRYLRESNIINHNMEIMDNCFAVLSKDDDFNILINDEDHFKIQAIKPGLQLSEAYHLADEVDDRLNKFAVYAFSNEMGYVSSNPLKSALKASIMLHLPVLYFTKRINEAQNIVKLNRFKIKGLKEEGIKTFGNMFIISNDFPVGVMEIEIMEELEKVACNIIDLESSARDSYYAEHGIRLEDKICRSFGILKYARKMGYLEAMDYLSDIRLGIILSVIKNINLQKINHLMINIQWSHLQKIADRIFNNTTEGDVFRALYLREQLGWGMSNG